MTSFPDKESPSLTEHTDLRAHAVGRPQHRRDESSCAWQCRRGAGQRPNWYRFLLRPVLSMSGVCSSSTMQSWKVQIKTSAKRDPGLLDNGAFMGGSGFSVPGMVFSLPEVLFSRIWVFSSHGVSCSRWCFQFPPPWVCGSHSGVFRYHVGV